MAIPLSDHPCLKCGACCAFFRVSFHWTETLEESHGVPLNMTTQISPYVNAMKGTDQQDPSCVAFSGLSGESASCEIYDHRPSACRLFKASFEDGARHVACETARAGKGFAALTLADWPSRADSVHDAGLDTSLE